MFSKNKSFWFDNYWMDDPDCHLIISKIWNSMANSTPLHMFSHLAARTRSNLIAWHSNGLNSLDRELRYTELKINDLESSDSLDNPD